MQSTASCATRAVAWSTDSTRFPMFRWRPTPAAIAVLRRSPGIAAVVPDTPIPVADAESTPLVGATATQAAGVDGSGQAIAVLDTGIDKAHPFLAGKVVDEPASRRR